MVFDLAIITILPEEFRAAMSILEDTTVYRPPAGQVNAYGWQTGLLRTTNGPGLRTVVAMLHDAGQVSGTLGTLATLERFRPRYTVVLGVAGSMPEKGPRLGDVVISSIIWGYEYGKVRDGFAPRGDRTYQVDGPLLRSASAHAVLHSKWHETIETPRPRRAKSVPQMVTGPIASGDKVIDNASDPFVVGLTAHWPKLVAVEMEGAGAAAAARAASEQGLTTGLIMVRGISDEVPESLDAGTATGGTRARDDWKPYASASAAAFLASWARAGWPTAPIETSRVAPDPAEPPRASATGLDANVRIAHRERLARLFATRTTATMLLVDAGFDPARVDLSGGAEAMWFNALREVENHVGGFDRLRAAVERKGYTL